MEEQIKELTLLLLYLTSWTEKEPYGEYQRAWKGYDFDILNNLEDEKLIGGSTHKAKSTYITDEGIKKAKELMKKYNIKCELKAKTRLNLVFEKQLPHLTMCNN